MKRHTQLREEALRMPRHEPTTAEAFYTTKLAPVYPRGRHHRIAAITRRAELAKRQHDASS